MKFKKPNNFTQNRVYFLFQTRKSVSVLHDDEPAVVGQVDLELEHPDQPQGRRSLENSRSDDVIGRPVDFVGPKTR
jgi:hypothetical protein